MDDTTTFRDIVPTTYICNADLKGRDRTLTIERVEIEEMFANNKKDTRPVLYFAGARKGLVVNSTINGVVSRLYGQYLKGWIGKRITIYPTVDDRGGGGTKDVVRVRPSVPPAPAASAGPKPAAADSAGQKAEDAGRE